MSCSVLQGPTDHHHQNLNAIETFIGTNNT
jgi:hypothetical protein